MANDRADKFSKIILGGFGLLLTVVGYFLTGRDAAIEASFGKLWAEIGSIRAAQYASNVDAEKIHGELVQRGEVTKWIIDTQKDQEQRIRALEEKCRKP